MYQNNYCHLPNRNRWIHVIHVFASCSLNHYLNTDRMFSMVRLNDIELEQVMPLVNQRSYRLEQAMKQSKVDHDWDYLEPFVVLDFALPIYSSFYLCNLKMGGYHRVSFQFWTRLNRLTYVCFETKHVWHEVIRKSFQLIVLSLVHLVED